MAREVFFFPPAPDAAALHDICCRAAWAFAPWASRIGAIRIWSDAAIPELKPGPAGFDDQVVRYFEVIRPLIRLEPANGDALPRILDAAARSGAVVLVWRWPTSQIERARLDSSTRAIREQGGDIWNVDPDESMNEGSCYLWSGLRGFGSPGEGVAESRMRLEAFAARPRKQRAYVFGTGPSLEQSYGFDLSDGDCIISNSIVANPGLLEKLRPIAVTACDPIFHAGCSQYAAAFRTHLRRALEACPDMVLFTVQRDYRHYLMSLPEHLHDRIIAAPFREAAPFNFDLVRDFHLHPAGNVLTLGLLPLAGSFYERITIIGCDGRPLEQNGYFWPHHKQSQINDKMVNIQLVHPAFFARSYDDHYEAHCRSVAEVIDRMEEAGKRIDSGTPSYIPALHAREPAALQDLSDVLLVSVNPDAKSRDGHWVSYDDRLAEICRQVGASFVSLAHQDLDVEILAPRPYYRLAFRFETWGVGERPNDGIDMQRLAEFEATLEREVERLTALHASKRVLLYMYTGSLPHAAAILKIVLRFPAVRACINTFWTCVMDCEKDGYIDAWAPFLRATRGHPRFRIFAITPQLKAIIAGRTGVALPLLPHPSPSARDQDTKAWLETRLLRRAPKRVLFPGGTTRDKGFAMTAEASILLTQKHPEISVCVRAQVREGSDENARPAIERIAHAGIEVIDRTVDDSEFISLVRAADVIVLPYDPKAWRYRNSGLGADALLAGAPIVCFAGTWLGDIVARHGAGIALEDVRPEAVVEAVGHILADYDRYRANTLRAARAYRAANTWAVLADAVFAVLAAPPAAEADASGLSPVGKRSRRTTTGTATKTGTKTGTGTKTAIATGTAIAAAIAIAIAAATANPAAATATAIIASAIIAAAFRTTIHHHLSRQTPFLAFLFHQAGRFSRRNKLLTLSTCGFGGALLLLVGFAGPGSRTSVATVLVAGAVLVAAFVAAVGSKIVLELAAESAREQAKQRERETRNRMAALFGTLQDRIDRLTSAIATERSESNLREDKKDERIAMLEAEVTALTAERDSILRHMRR